MRVGSSRWDQSPWKKRQWASSLSLSDWGVGQESTQGGGQPWRSRKWILTRNPTASFQNWEWNDGLLFKPPGVQGFCSGRLRWTKMQILTHEEHLRGHSQRQAFWTGEGVRTVGETTERISLWLEHSQERQSQEMNLAELPTSGLCRDFFSLIGSTKHWVYFPVLHNRCLLVIYFIYRSIYIWNPKLLIYPSSFSQYSYLTL